MINLLQHTPRLTSRLMFGAAIRALSDDSLWSALALQTNTTPGPDGFPFQAYLPFGLEGVRVLRDLLLEIAETGVCPAALKDGELFLIPKKGPPLVDNLRPITVANTSYRLIMSITKLVISSAAEELLSPSQKAFLKGRRMVDHIEEVLETFYMDKSLRHASRYMFVDFTKAYDRVHRGSMLRILTRMGFDRSFINLVGALNSDTQVSWSGGGRKYVFQTDRGVRVAPCLPFSSIWL